MKIEKWKCDGCGQEGSLEEFTLRIVNQPTLNQKVAATILESEQVKVSIPLENSLDFCTITCFDLYIANLKLAQEKGEL